jgi:hypothetical protein
VSLILPPQNIVVPNQTILDKVNPVIFEHYRKGKLIDREITHNGITTPGKNSLFDVYFRAQTQITTWYFGLIDNASFSALNAADTMSSHAGWIECTTYDESARPTWSPDAAASGAITNTTAVTFNISATKTLNGMFIVSNSTKGGTTGVLWATASFSTTKSVVDDDQIKLTYQLSA